jgi:8-oxo-dGTP pyrophosphatase MutT (NUDIX family)
VTDDYVAPRPTKRNAAGVLFFDELGRVLVVEPTYKVGWEFPGGAVEVGESPHAGAVREVEEEIGLVLTRRLPLLVVDWAPASAGRSDAVVWLFDGGVMGDAARAGLRLPPDELRSFRFVDPTEAAALLPGPRVRRLAAALAARAAQWPVYLEDGRDPSAF